MPLASVTLHLICTVDIMWPWSILRATGYSYLLVAMTFYQQCSPRYNNEHQPIQQFFVTQLVSIVIRYCQGCGETMKILTTKIIKLELF